VIGGWTTLDRGDPYVLHDSLTAFLDTAEPVVAVSFGSMPIPDPATLVSVMSSAAARIRAKVVICQSWSFKVEATWDMLPNTYITDAVPHI
jgi:hypothetical protein